MSQLVLSEPSISGRVAAADSRVLFVTRYFWPELIGSAPFTSDIADWLARHGRRTTVLSGLPYYPGTEVFPAYRDGGRTREMVGAVAVVVSAERQTNRNAAAARETVATR